MKSEIKKGFSHTLIVLETKRVKLCTLDETNSATVLNYYLKNRIFLKPFDPIRDDEFYQAEHHKRQLIDDVERQRQGRVYRFYLFKKEDRQKLHIIGIISISEIVRGCFLSCFLGYKGNMETQNQGYISEAVSAVVDFAFNTLKLHRIEANIMPRNLASLRVVENNQFVSEGISKKYLYINGVWEDHIHMVKLNDALEKQGLK